MRKVLRIATLMTLIAGFVAVASQVALSTAQAAGAQKCIAVLSATGMGSGCMDTGCSTAGGVCGEPLANTADEGAAAVALDPCWCLF